MRMPIFLMATVGAMLLWGVSTAQPPGPDKFKPGDPKKDLPKITADTEINGKVLREWIKAIPGKDRSQTELAVESIVLYGPDLAHQAVPMMIDELNKHKPSAPIDLSVRVAIPPALALILSGAKATTQQEVQDTVTIFKKMLADPQIIVKIRVAQALGRMGPMAKEAIPELMSMAKDAQSPTWEARHAAVVALSTTSYDPKTPPSQAVLTTLIGRLSDSAIKVRLAALQSLTLVHASEDKQLHAKLRSEVIKMVNGDPDAVGKLRANMFLYTLSSAPAEKKDRVGVIGRVGGFLNHDEAHVRMEACQIMGTFGTEAKDQGPALMKRLTDPELAVMGWAMWALGQLQYEPALTRLQQIASDPKVPEPFRDTAKEAMNDIRGIKKKAEPK